MFGKVFTMIILGIALLMAVLVTVLKPEHFDYLILISRFFDVMLPILAVGALVKYLTCGSKGHCHTSDNDHTHTH